MGLLGKDTAPSKTVLAPASPVERFFYEAEAILKNIWQNDFTLFFINRLKRSNVQYALSYLTCLCS
jgi:hypothetical protein